MNESATFPSMVQYFFAQHLCVHKQASPRTITAYRDTFRLLLDFVQNRTGRSASSLTITDLDAPTILAFLAHLESIRGNKARSRNAHLCAIKSFFHIVGLRDPANLDLVSQVQAVPLKKTDRSLITYLTREEMDAILAASDQTTWLGSRDHALLLTLYNTGARASEMINLVCGQVAFGSHTFIHVHGKAVRIGRCRSGRKRPECFRHGSRRRNPKRTASRSPPCAAAAYRPTLSITSSKRP